MDKVRVDLAELKQAIAEIESRTNDVRITIEIQNKTVKFSSADKQDNMLEAVLYDEANLGAQFRCTERLMFMKKKNMV